MKKENRIRFTGNDDPELHAGYWVVEIFNHDRWILVVVFKNEEDAKKELEEWDYTISS